MIRIAVDAMGGDFGLETTIEASILAVKKYSDIEITLFGDKELIEPRIKGYKNILIHNTKSVLDMGEKDAIRAIRNNRDSSMVLALKHGKEKLCDAVVSSGPTQCLIAGAHLVVKKMPNMSRVALCPIIPSLDKKGRLLLDVGANLELRPEHILDLATYASVVVRVLQNKQDVRVGLLNIGTEESKGREVDKETFKLLSTSGNFIFHGNVEPKDILSSEADVLITDGFTGNMILKTIEGTAKSLGQMLKEELKGSFLGIVGALLAKKRLKRFAKRLDSSEIGGAMIIGVNIPIIKAHGSSNSIAFFNAIKQARMLSKEDLINKVIKALPKEDEKDE